MNSSHVNIALIGCGTWGKNIARTLAEMKVLGAICDGHSYNPYLIAHCETYKTPLLSFSEILNSSEITAVAIATPTETHFDLAKQALEAGKHVFVEKPLVRCRTQNEELIALAHAQNKTLMVGHILRYHPAYLKLKQECEKGTIGPINYVSSRRSNLGRFFPGESALWDFAPHDLSMVLGLFQKKPERVFCHEQGYFEKGVGDKATLEIDFGNNQHAHLYFSRYSPIKEQKMIVHGTQGFFCFEDTKPLDQKLILHTSYVKNHASPVIEKGETLNIPLEEISPLFSEFQAFVEVIHQRRSSESSAKDALEVLDIILAAEKSLRAGTWQAL